MMLAIVLLGIWALVVVPMALVLFVDDDKHHPSPKAPVISVGERRQGGARRNLPDAA